MRPQRQQVLQHAVRHVVARARVERLRLPRGERVPVEEPARAQRRRQRATHVEAVERRRGPRQRRQHQQRRIDEAIPCRRAHVRERREGAARVVHGDPGKLPAGDGLGVGAAPRVQAAAAWPGCVEHAAAGAAAEDRSRARGEARAIDQPDAVARPQIAGADGPREPRVEGVLDRDLPIARAADAAVAAGVAGVGDQPEGGAAVVRRAPQR